MVENYKHTRHNTWGLLITFRSHCPFAGTMIDHLHLVTISMVNPLVLLFLTTPALCEDKGNLLEVLPISLPPSQLWYAT